MKKLQIVLIVFLSLILLVLSALAIFFSCQFQFPQGTEVCKTDISDMIPMLAAEKIQNRIDSYTVTLTVNGQSHTFTAKDLSLRLNREKLDQLAREMQAGNETADMGSFLTMDSAPVQALLAQLLPEDRVEPGDYQLQWNEAQAAFELVNGTPGSYNSQELALQAIAGRISRLDRSITLTEADYRTAYTDPEKTAAAQTALNQANELVSCELTYCFYQRSGAVAQECIDRATIGSWLVVGRDGLSVTLNQTRIQEYADTMAAAYSMEGEGHFMSHNGDEINLPATIPANQVDAQALYEDIYQSLTNLEPGEREVPYQVRSAYANFDGTYIEISISEQKLLAYLDGELFAETDIVTGCAHCDHDTLTGVFEIQNRAQDIWLKEGYFVSYWMGFYIPKYGLHDADRWRSEYGGTIYRTNGSGGCVNVPGEVLAKIYDAFDVGVPVIIYDDSYLISSENAA